MNIKIICLLFLPFILSFSYTQGQRINSEDFNQNLSVVNDVVSQKGLNPPITNINFKENISIQLLNNIYAQYQQLSKNNLSLPTCVNSGEVIDASCFNEYFEKLLLFAHNDLGFNEWGNGSDGDFVSTGLATDQFCGSDVDGEMCVKEFNNFVINESHLVTTQVRRRGLIIYVKGDATINGILSMSARGAKGDPAAFGVPASGLTFARFSSSGNQSGASSLIGAGTDVVGVEARQPEVSNGVNFNIPSVGAPGGARVTTLVTNVGTNNGFDGIGGQTGGGGSGNLYVNYSVASSGAGTAGTCFSGGSGGGGTFADSAGAATDAAAFGGAGGNGAGNHPWQGGGGGAGNPGGLPGACGAYGCPLSGENGTGGLLVLVVKGNLIVGENGSIESKGSNGRVGVSGIGKGGGSGGGSVLIIHAGDNTPLEGKVNVDGGNAAGKGSLQVGKVSL